MNTLTAGQKVKVNRGVNFGTAFNGQTGEVTKVLSYGGCMVRIHDGDGTLWNYPFHANELTAVQPDVAPRQAKACG